MASQDDLKRELSTILDTAKDRRGASNALGLLFPPAARALDLFLPERVTSGRKLRERRLSSDAFANYFSLTPDVSSWSRSEVESIIQKEPTGAFTAAMEKILLAPEGDRELLSRSLLERLSDMFSEEISLTNEWLRSIVSASTKLITMDSAEGAFSLSNLDRLRIIVCNGIRTLEPTQRTRLIVHAANWAQDLTLLCDVVRSILGDRRADGAAGDRHPDLSFEEGAPRVRSTLLRAVRRMAAQGRMWVQAEPREVLWFWWGSGKAGETAKFADKEMESLSGLVGLATVCIGVTVSSTDGAYYSIQGAAVSKLLNLERLRAEIEEALRRRSLPAEARMILKRFQEAKLRD